MWLDRTQVEIGGVVTALVRVTNRGPAVLERDRDTCGAGPAATTVVQRGNTRTLAGGLEWPGRADVFKHELLNSAGLGAQRDLGAFRDPTSDPKLDCSFPGLVVRFPPGSRQALLVWRAVAGPASVIVAGPTIVSSTFESVEWGLNPAPLLKATAEVEIEVVRPDASADPVGPTLVDYVDAALSVDDFRNWINGMRAGYDSIRSSPSGQRRTGPGPTWLRTPVWIPIPSSKSPRFYRTTKTRSRNSTP